MFNFSKKKKAIKFSTDPGVSWTEWRKDPELIAAAVRLFSDPDFKAMYSTLISSRPSKTSLPIGCTMEQLASQAMFISGFEYCLDMIISLGKEAESEVEASPTFQDE